MTALATERHLETNQTANANVMMHLVVPSVRRRSALSKTATATVCLWVSRGIAPANVTMDGMAKLVAKKSVRLKQTATVMAL
jgi:hypothetical protein